MENNDSLYDNILDTLHGNNKDLLVNTIKNYFSIDDLYSCDELTEYIKENFEIDDILSRTEIIDYCNENCDIEEVYSQKYIDSHSSINTESIEVILNRYYSLRNMKRPDAIQALLFLVSEVGELADAKVSTMAKWDRNNPDKISSIEYEIGDIFMMLTVFSLEQTGITPEKHLINKLKKVLKEKNIDCDLLIGDNK